MQDFWSDIRFALRQLRRDPGYTTAAVCTLALGIAATSIVFSVYSGVLLRPLPYANPDRLVEVTGFFPGPGRLPLSTPEFFDLEESRGIFATVATAAPISANLTGTDQPERIESRAVTAGFFTMLGVAPLLGRTFTADDQRPGITEIAVISHGLWRRHFGGRRDALGRTLLLDDDRYVIVGVMPAGFAHPGESHSAPVELWYPAGFRATPFPPPSRAFRGGLVVGRLAPGVSLDQAQAQVTAVARGMGARFPDVYAEDSGWDIRLRPLHEALVGDARTPLAVLLAAVGSVLLIACANIASLQLAHGATRAAGTREISVEGRVSRGPPDIIRSEWRSASPGYFGVMGVPLLDGRGLTDQDAIDAPRVAVINRSLARRLWPGESALGQRIKAGAADSPAPWLTVVGVVGDVRAQGLDVDPREQVYVSYLQSPPIILSLAVRSATNPDAFGEPVRRAVRAVEHDQPVFAVQSMDVMMRIVDGRRRVAMVGLTTFAILAVLLAAVGAYGLVSYNVAQRTREFGVRQALGADGASLVRLVLGQGGRVGAVGIAAGLIAAFPLTRALGGLLFGVGPADPVTFSVLPVALFGLVLLACYLPGRRASRVSPSAALRME